MGTELLTRRMDLIHSMQSGINVLTMDTSYPIKLSGIIIKVYVAKSKVEASIYNEDSTTFVVKNQKNETVVEIKKPNTLDFSGRQLTKYPNRNEYVMCIIDIDNAKIYICSQSMFSELITPDPQVATVLFERKIGRDNIKKTLNMDAVVDMRTTDPRTFYDENNSEATIPVDVFDIELNASDAGVFVVYNSLTNLQPALYGAVINEDDINNVDENGKSNVKLGPIDVVAPGTIKLYHGNTDQNFEMAKKLERNVWQNYTLIRNADDYVVQELFEQERTYKNDGSLNSIKYGLTPVARTVIERFDKIRMYFSPYLYPTALGTDSSSLYHSVNVVDGGVTLVRIAGYVNNDFKEKYGIIPEYEDDGVTLKKNSLYYQIFKSKTHVLSEVASYGWSHYASIPEANREDYYYVLSTNAGSTISAWDTHVSFIPIRLSDNWMEITIQSGFNFHSDSTHNIIINAEKSSVDYLGSWWKEDSVRRYGSEINTKEDGSTYCTFVINGSEPYTLYDDYKCTVESSSILRTGIDINNISIIGSSGNYVYPPSEGERYTLYPDIFDTEYLVELCEDTRHSTTVGILTTEHEYQKDNRTYKCLYNITGAKNDPRYFKTGPSQYYKLNTYVATYPLYSVGGSTTDNVTELLREYYTFYRLELFKRALWRTSETSAYSHAFTSQEDVDGNTYLKRNSYNLYLHHESDSKYNETTSKVTLEHITDSKVNQKLNSEVFYYKNSDNKYYKVTMYYGDNISGFTENDSFTEVEVDSNNNELKKSYSVLMHTYHSFRKHPHQQEVLKTWTDLYQHDALMPAPPVEYNKDYLKWFKDTPCWKLFTSSLTCTNTIVENIKMHNIDIRYIFKNVTEDSDGNPQIPTDKSISNSYSIYDFLLFAVTRYLSYNPSDPKSYKSNYSQNLAFFPLSQINTLNNAELNDNKQIVVNGTPTSITKTVSMSNNSFNNKSILSNVEIAFIDDEDGTDYSVNNDNIIYVVSNTTGLKNSKAISLTDEDNQLLSLTGNGEDVNVDKLNWQTMLLALNKNQSIDLLGKNMTELKNAISSIMENSGLSYKIQEKNGKVILVPYDNSSENVSYALLNNETNPLNIGGVVIVNGATSDGQKITDKLYYCHRTQFNNNPFIYFESIEDLTQLPTGNYNISGYPYHISETYNIASSDFEFNVIRIYENDSFEFSPTLVGNKSYIYDFDNSQPLKLGWFYSSTGRSIGVDTGETYAGLYYSTLNEGVYRNRYGVRLYIDITQFGSGSFTFKDSYGNNKTIESSGFRVFDFDDYGRASLSVHGDLDARIDIQIEKAITDENSTLYHKIQEMIELSTT